ncbi:aldose epimerase family protein [Bacillus sp. B15-48]|uniref:aldose epimerase family protein n=1 Tax=Bacillus sp. B15-48 TaxID=1548601 RepID=UPI00193FC56F|nr:aldose epimerase family protein [Bacillus sp. B15-48]MBM4761189.1 galactose-1-epimerase [Bacillus sp. B15-48]
MKVTETIFGELAGRQVKAYTLANNQGMAITCLDYGCTITNISVPDRNGKIENVVLGFDSIENYLQHSPYFGCVVGRVAGRIGESQFDLDGITYELPKNEGDNHLHGGPKGFQRQIWDSSVAEGGDECSIQFTYLSPDGESGYPGNLEVTVKYSLNNKNELSISYQGTTDKKTVVDLTNHSYFNLSGDGKRNILNHQLQLKSEQFLELDDSLLPTGQLLDVKNTPFDFTSMKKIGEEIESEHDQVKLVGGYDHPFLLSDHHCEEIILIDETSGRKLVVETDKPSVVCYTSNMLRNDFQIRGVQAEKHLGICLETQSLPDAVHHPHFPSIVLEPNTCHQSKTIYKFSCL